MSHKKYTLLVESLQNSNQYYFVFLLPGNFIEMYEIKNHKVYLKKMHHPDIQVEDLYLTNLLKVQDQKFRILGYSDEFTKKQLSSNIESNKTLALIKPICRQGTSESNKLIEICKILEKIQCNFMINQLKIMKFNEEEATNFYLIEQCKSKKQLSYFNKNQDEPFNSKEVFENKVKYLSSGKCVAIQLISPLAITKWKRIIGNQNPKTALSTNPNSIRAAYGIDLIKNSVHGSNSVQHVQQEILTVFSLKTQCTLLLKNSTLCIIKPHIIQEKKVAHILSRIAEEGFLVVNLQMRRFKKQKVLAFMEAYTFMPDYYAIVHQLSENACIVLEIIDSKPDKYHVVEKFKKLCGPYDPEFARKIEPKCLRALFGKSRAQNAVQCTDLIEDSESELKLMLN